MYSVWQNSNFDPNPENLSTKQMLDAYRSRARLRSRHCGVTVTSPAADEGAQLDTVHSSYWQKRLTSSSDDDVSAAGEEDVGRDKRCGDVITSHEIAPTKYKVGLYFESIHALMTSQA